MSFVGITSEDDDEEASSGFLLPVPDFIDVLDASCLQVDFIALWMRYVAQLPEAEAQVLAKMQRW